MVKDTLSQSRRKMHDLNDDSLGISLGSFVMYIPISTTSILPHFSVENTLFLLPLYSKELLAIQDLLLEYAGEVVKVCSLYKSRRAVSKNISHHHSSSSLNLLMGGTMMGVNNTRNTDRMIPTSSRQNLLQKGAKRVKEITSTVKNNVATSHKKISETERKKEFKISFSIDKCSIRVQLVEEMIFKYNIKSLVAYYTSELILVNACEHEAFFLRISSAYTERFLSIPELPEISFSMRIPPKKEPVPANRGTHLRSNSALSSLTRLFIDNTENASRPGTSGLNSNSGVPVEKEEPISIRLDVNVFKIELLTKHVSVLTGVVV